MQQAASENPDVVFISMTGDTAALSGLDKLQECVHSHV
jgi:ABC-type Fe2+-enterobactin transport system substrate-binding protein